MTPASQESIASHPPKDWVAFDRRCRQYVGVQAQLETLKKQAAELKAMILLDVNTGGYIPENAPRSRRIGSNAFIATVTTSVGIEVNHEWALRLEALMSRARVPSDVFPQLFERHVEYTLAKTAPQTIETTKFPKRFAEEIMTAYALCTKPKVKSTSLEVESRAAVAERERKAAEKLAAKANRKPRKAVV